MTDPTLDELESNLKIAQLKQAIAEARRQEAEANKAADQAERDLASAPAQTARDEEKAAAETRKAVLEADAGAVKALLPGDPTLKPLEGTVSIDGSSGIVAEIATYAILDSVAESIVTSLEKNQPSLLSGGPPLRLLILNDRQLVASDWQYLSIKQQIAELLSESDAILDGGAQRDRGAPVEKPELRIAPDLIPIPGASALSIAAHLPAIVGAAADVAGYFQSNYTIAGRPFDAKVEPFVTAIAGALAKKGALVVVDGFQVIPDTELIAEFGKLMSARAKIKLASIEQVGQTEAPEESDPIKQLGQRIEAFTAGVYQPSVPGTLPPLAQAALREALHEGANQFTHVLYAGISSSGGEVQTRQRRFLTPVVRYVGACVATVLITQVADGVVAFARSFPIVASVTYLIKDGAIGRLQEVTISDRS